MAGLLTADETTWITNVVTSSFDTQVSVYRKTTASDGHGGTTETYPNTATSTPWVNTFKPSATTLQTFAGIIGSSQAMMLRFVPATTDIREGDRVVLFGLNWIVQNVQKAESYTIAYDALITVIT